MTLDETYERILLGIDREKREHAIRLLKCLAFSRRPLRVKELAEVLAVRFGTTIPMLDPSLRPRDADEAVLSACSTLVTTIGLDDCDHNDDDDDYPQNSRVVQFSHYSVKEYLTSSRLAESDKRDLSQYYISPEPAHTTLAQSCISTLLQSDHIGDITDNFPLAKYAAQNWFHHAQCDGVASQILDGMEHLFDTNKKHFATWISIHDIDGRLNRGPSTKTKASPLYYATLCGVVSLVEHLVVTRQQDPNECCGSQGTPLHAAVVSGHTAIVRFLLEHTAEVNARDMDVAVRNGNLDITQLLLGHGADVNAVDSLGDSVLHKAVQSQNRDVVELLLKSGAHVNVQNRYNPNPLYEAMDSGNLDITQLLLKHGADVNILSHQGCSPLHKAVRSQKLDFVELLLKSGADVNSRNLHSTTLLHDAVGGGNIDTIKILLHHGADVNALDYLRDSPLHKVLQIQSPSLVNFPINTINI